MKIIKLILVMLIILNPAFSEEIKPLSFNAALNEILSNHWRIQSQEFKIKSSETRLISHKLSLLPAIRASSSQSQGSLSPISRDYELKSDVNIFRWGADIKTLNALELDLLSEKMNMDQTIIQAEREATQILVNIIFYSKKTLILQEIVTTYRKLFETAKKRYEMGKLALQEVEKLEIDLENAKSNLADTELQSLSQQLELEKLIGHSQIQTEWPWQEIVLKKNLKNFSFSVSELPSWKGLKTKLDAEELRTSQTKWAFLPALNGNLKYGYYSSWGTAWSASINVSMPLFEPWSTYSQFKMQKINTQDLEVQFRKRTDNFRSDYDNAQKSFVILQDATLSKEKALSTAKRLYENSFKRFQLGFITVNDLALDEQRFYDLELSFNNGIKELHLSLVRFCHSLGFRLGHCLE
ncbi:MAG: TolC family protein [Deltaproteobacteria bacterium]|nr:TolC family protein [Deltaproteobacteria bacterium]